jgi:hypothetical protein
MLGRPIASQIAVASTWISVAATNIRLEPARSTGSAARIEIETNRGNSLRTATLLWVIQRQSRQVLDALHRGLSCVLIINLIENLDKVRQKMSLILNEPNKCTS